jgi:hypothetical protein
VTEITRQFDLKVWDNSGGANEGDWINADPCHSDPLVTKVAASLLFIRDLPPLPSYQDDFDQNLIGPDSFDFFQKRIHTIYFDPSSAHCDADVVALVNDPESHSLHFCPYASSFSSLLISTVLMHESRHIEGYPHLICEQGGLIGSFACDDSYAYGGAYAIGAEFEVRIARDPQISGAVREEARATAVADFLTRFNHAPLGAQEGLLLLSTDEKLEYFDGQTATELYAPVPPTSVVSVRDLPVIFDPVTNTVQSIQGTGQLVKTDGSLAEEYRNFSDEKKADMVDVIYGELSCFLFRKSIRCEKGDDTVDFPLPKDLEPRKLLVLDIGAGANVYIVAEDGTKFALPSDEKLANWVGKPIVPETLPSIAPFTSFAMLSDGRRYGIALDGTLVSYDETKQGYIPVPAKSGKKFLKMIAPLFWSNRFKEL